MPSMLRSSPGTAAHVVGRRLASIPGVGPITAMAIASTVPDPSMLRSGREFAAWLGLTPKSYSSAGKNRLGRILKPWRPRHPTPVLRWRLATQIGGLFEAESSEPFGAEITFRMNHVFAHGYLEKPYSVNC